MFSQYRGGAPLSQSLVVSRASRGVIAANQVRLLKALFKQLAGSLLLRHTGIQFAAIHSWV